MATLQQQALHWRDRAIQRSEVISDGWQVALAYAGRGAEIVLFICMAISLIEMIPTITLPDLFTSAVFVVQMITLDVAGYGLTTLAKAIKRAGDEETAKKAGTIGTCLIIIMVISMLTGGIDRLFGVKFPVVKEYMVYLDDVLILVRVGMTVLYGKIMHALRDSQQHMQAQVDETEARLREELAQSQASQRKSQENVSKLSKQVTDLTNRLEEAQKTLFESSEGQGTIIMSLQKKVADLTGQLQDKQQLSADLQSARSTIFRLQNAESETAKLRLQMETLTDNLQSANLQNADLAEKLEKTKKKLSDLPQQSERPASAPKQEAAGTGKITLMEKVRKNMRMAHEDVLKFMDAHPDLTRAEVAAKLEISERKVYDAVAWRRENLQGGNAVSQ